MVSRTAAPGYLPRQCLRATESKQLHISSGPHIATRCWGGCNFVPGTTLRQSGESCLTSIKRPTVLAHRCAGMATCNPCRSTGSGSPSSGLMRSYEGSRGPSWRARQRLTGLLR